MLKRKNRLPKIFLKNRRLISSPLYDLKVKENGELFSRFGFVISKKIDKRATVRNKIRRKFRNCIEEKLNKIEKGYDFLFVLKKNILGESYCETLYDQLRYEKLLKI